MDDGRRAHLRQEVELGQRMLALLNDEQVAKCISQAKAAVHAEWEDEVNADKRNELWLKLVGMRLFIDSLNRVVETGKLAGRSLSMESDRGKK